MFAVQTGISTDLTAGERLRADIVAEDEDACAFVAATEATGATFALDGIRAEWKIYCIRSAYYIYKNYGSDIYQEALKIIVEAWWAIPIRSCLASSMALPALWQCTGMSTAGSV